MGTKNVVDTPPDWSENACCGHFGGKLEDVPKPHFYLWDKLKRKREVRVRITKFYGVGVHYYADLKEEDDAVWNRRIDPPYTKQAHWQKCWNDPKTDGRSFLRRCNTPEEAVEFVRQTQREHFPKKTHKLVEDIDRKEWFYKEGD